MQRLESTARRDTFLSFQPPAVGDEEVEAVVETLRSGWLTSGPRAAELEERFAEYVGATHAIALASGTAALHLALAGLDIGPGDEVIVPRITWPATANVVVHTGATPVFVDVLDENLNIDPEAARSALTRRTKAIMPVHLAGAPADLDPLLELGVRVVEDAAHAVESVYRGRKVGSISDATAFSLYATKNVAAGEGGILTTDNDRLAEAVLGLRFMRRGHGALYDIEVAGFKANLSDVLAALALVQLGKVEEHAEIRRRHFAAYDAGIADLDGIEPLSRGGASDVHARHLYIVRIDPERAGAGRDEYQRALADENIGTSIHFLPVHRLTYYRERFPDVQLPVAERAGSEVLSLPLSPAHSDEDIRDAVGALQRVHASFASS